VGYGVNGGFTGGRDKNGRFAFKYYGGREGNLAGSKGRGGIPFHLGGFEVEAEASAGFELTHNF